MVLSWYSGRKHRQSLREFKERTKSQHFQKQKKKEKTNKNPRDGANCFSIFCYWWLVALFRRGRQKPLQAEDLYDVLDGLESDQLGERLERGWTNELLFAMDTSREPRVTNAIWFAFGASFVILTASLLFVEALYIFQGVMLYWYVLSSVSQEYLLSLSVSSALSIMLHHGWNAVAMTVGTQLRISCHSLLCKKLLKLDANYNRVKEINEKMSQVTEGLVLAELAMVKAPYILIGPFYAVLVLGVLWVYFDRTAIVGLVILLTVLIPLLVMSRQVAARILSQCLPAKRERLFLLEEAATAMFQIKQRSLTEVVRNKISTVRGKESTAMGYNAVLHTMVGSIQTHGPNIVILLSVTVYTLAQQAFSEEDAFLILCLVQTLTNPLCVNLPMGFGLLTKLTATIEVLQELLVMVDAPESGRYDAELPCDTRFSLLDVSAECFSNGPTMLSKINFNVREGQILAVVGPCRAGKTPLLYLLQGEIEARSGTVSVRGRSVFCPHTPWLLPAASVRDNIICGKHINEQRLKLVLEVCGLVRDIQELPKGEVTILGTDDGVALTLQQISKINLARTLYHDCDIYLLDDPFRWLGRQVSDRIFSRCILRLLKDKTVVLVTDKHRHIIKSDQIIALRNGKVEGFGTFEELVKTISILEQSSDLTSDDLDTDSEDSDMDEPSSTATNNQLNIVECSYKYCRRYSYYPQPQSPMLKSSSVKSIGSSLHVEGVEPEVVGPPTWSEVWRVVGSARSRVGVVVTILGLLLSQGLLSTWDYCFIVGLGTNSSISTWHNWLKAPLSENVTPLPALWYLSTGAVLAGVAVNYNLSVMLNKATSCVHDRLVQSFLHSPITFLDQHILNKIFSCLSQDIRVLDEFLVPACLALMQHCLLLIGCLGLVVVAYCWFLLPTLLLVTFTFYLFHTCLPTTKALETIEAKLWRPVQAHFQVSEDQIVTLRSLKASDFYRRQFADHQDRHSSALFLQQAVTESLSLWLSLACVAFTTCITVVFYIIEEERSVVALGTYSCLMVTNLVPFLVSDMTLASRLLEVVRHMVQACQMPMEATDHPHVGSANPTFSGDIDLPIVSQSWPLSGEIRAMNLTLVNKAGHATLENLHFTIEARETVGIVGSGKSSLLAALLRLEEPAGGGSVLIDNVDTRDVPIRLLRSKISVIPRHPIFCAGLLRTNLDPHDQFSDSQLWEAIDKVGLLEIVAALPFGLMTESRHWDKTFTAAQRQLLHLALAVISANKILIIDLTSRTTSPESDRSLVNLVHLLLPSSTVIIMSERLRLVMATERVLVLDSGKLKEFGHPYLLLQNRHSHLNKMIQDAGPKELHAELLTLARQAYMSERMPVMIREELTDSSNSSPVMV